VTVIVTVEAVDVGRNNVNSSWIWQKWQLESQRASVSHCQCECDTDIPILIVIQWYWYFITCPWRGRTDNW